jgi:hypothetical protein
VQILLEFAQVRIERPTALRIGRIDETGFLALDGVSERPN